MAKPAPTTGKLPKIRRGQRGVSKSHDARVPATLEIVAVDLLEFHPDNVRLHGDRNVDDIKRSLERFGQQRPLITERGSNRVIVGNGTLQAMRSLGWTVASVVRSSLEGDEARAYAIADNRTAETSEWDFARLSEQLRSWSADASLLDATGFHEAERGPLLHAKWTPPAVDTSFDAAGELQNVLNSRDKSVRFTAEQWRTAAAIVTEWEKAAEVPDLENPAARIVRALQALPITLAPRDPRAGDELPDPSNDPASRPAGAPAARGGGGSRRRRPRAGKPST